MKITRSYLLGLGSGLIMSALMAIVIPILGSKDQLATQQNPLSQPSQAINVATGPKGSESGQSDVPKDSTPVPTSPVAQSTTPPTVSKSPTVPDIALRSNPVATPVTSSSNNPPTVTVTTQSLEKQFVIPNGVGSEWIAELLVSQGFIKDKAQFLETVEKRGVSGKFQVGSYYLLPGLTTDEVLNRLLKK